MFVFWYCHKRGKEVRLAKEAAEAGAENEDGTAEDGDDSYEDEDEDEDEAPTDEKAAEKATAMEEDISEKANVLSQPEPAQTPLPAEGSKEQTTEEATKSL